MTTEASQHGVGLVGPNDYRFALRVYIEDTDAGGIVYYVNYLKYMERCRTEFFRALGYDKPAILDTGLLLVVHSAETRYRRPARLDDKLLATARIEQLKRTSVSFCQGIWRGDQLLCEGLIRIACVDPAGFKPRPLPAPIHRQLVAILES